MRDPEKLLTILCNERRKLLGEIVYIFHRLGVSGGEVLDIANAMLDYAKLKLLEKCKQEVKGNELLPKMR
jgi:hypothetical protein